MKKPKKYLVVFAFNKRQLKTIVNKTLSEGWRKHGDSVKSKSGLLRQSFVLVESENASFNW